MSSLVMVAVLFFVGLAVLGYFALAGAKSAVATDPETLCVVDRPPSEVLAVVVDVSDSFSQAQRLQVVNAIDRLRLTLRKNGVLEIYPLSRDPGKLSGPTLSICNPGDGSDMNSMYQNPQLAKKRWESGFLRRVDAFVSQLMQQPDSKSSPIFEAIQSVALFSFGPVERDNVPKRLVVFSDLIQNVPGSYSQYHDGLDFVGLKDSAYFSSVRANLEEVDVNIFYLARPSAKGIQGARHIEFWNDYFSFQGAAVQEVTQIFGAK